MSRMFINGESVDSASKDVTEIHNPATGDLVDTAPKGTVDDVRAAIDAAYAARDVWRETDPSQRGELLHKSAAEVTRNEKDLAALLTREQGKPY
ncbi:MAG: aldehyde dehydrogenase family protein, partial [Chloroflexi bacterium]